VLDAIKLVTDNKKIIVVTLCDVSRLYSAINSNSQIATNKTESGIKNIEREQLLKLFDVSINIPDLTPGMTWSYIIKSGSNPSQNKQKYRPGSQGTIKSISGLTAGHISRLIRYANVFSIKNPRQIKSLINSYKLARTMYGVDGKEILITVNGKEEHHYPLMYVSALMESYYYRGLVDEFDEINLLSNSSVSNLSSQAVEDYKYIVALTLKLLQEKTRHHDLVEISKMFIFPPR
jgi:hypothetical protein